MSIYASGFTLARRILLAGKRLRRGRVVAWARSRLGLLPSSVMRVGVGKGLRFAPGPSNPAYGSGNNELPVQEAVRAHLRSGDILFDVGANVGFFSVIAARLVGPSGRVIAFEPVPENATRIRENARLNHFSQIEVVEQAVFRESGRSVLALAEYSGGSILAQVGLPPDASGRTIEVATTTIDDAIFKAGHPAPHLVKIDVEGAELDVLMGMERTLKELCPVVLFEVDDELESALEDKMNKCRAFLEARGYRVTRLPESYQGGDWKVAHGLATAV
jgi:FkbM family methyltransferase